MSLTLVTSLGDIKMELFCELCPKTCKNFLALAGSGFYNNTIFHRNIPGFIIQGGDKTGTGQGGECIYGDCFDEEFNSTLQHDKRGIVSMANNGPNTNKSQFFICYNKQSHLNNVYTVFGKVIDGFETLNRMEKEVNDNEDKPLNDIVLYKIIIHCNPIALNETV